MMIRKLLVAVSATLISASTLSPALAFDPSDAERIKMLVDTGMRYYWTGGDVKKAEAEVFKGITLHGRYDVVEQSFREAAKLAPERLDFLFAMASSQILQKKTDEAAETYRAILAKDPNSFEAQAWLEALARVGDNETLASLSHQSLAGLDASRAEDYRRRFVRVEQIMAEKPGTEIPTVAGKTTIVVLGYALAKDGTAEKPLLDRLDVGLKAAQANPDARVMVTGGQPQAGVTEGDVMMKWLVEHGIDRDRIMIEDKSKDTVGNVLNVANLLRRHTADTVILVTSSSHMRRARAVLEEALDQAGIAAPVLPVIALDAPTMEEAVQVTPEERLVVYRDLMRVSGLWAYPGIQQ